MKKAFKDEEQLERLAWKPPWVFMVEGCDKLVPKCMAKKPRKTWQCRNYAWIFHPKWMSHWHDSHDYLYHVPWSRIWFRFIFADPQVNKHIIQNSTLWSFGQLQEWFLCNYWVSCLANASSPQGYEYFRIGWILILSLSLTNSTCWNRNMISISKLHLDSYIALFYSILFTQTTEQLRALG